MIRAPSAPESMNLERLPTADAVASRCADLVAEVNEKRRAEYRRIAQRTGTAVRVVAARAGQRLMEKVPKGQYIKPGDEWVRK